MSLSTNNHSRYAIGVDLGGTKIAAVLLARSGAVIAHEQIATGAHLGGNEVTTRIAAMVNRLCRDLGDSVAGVGIGSPGQVDSVHGVVYQASNLAWDEVELARDVQAGLDCAMPVWLQKDANAEALGEYLFGAARGCENFVYLGLGTGLGCGIMADGRLITGHSWGAGELGHLVLDPDGYPCACGGYGCAETVVSGSGVINVARDYLQQGQFSTGLMDADPLSSSDLVSAARAGDPLALAVIDRCATWLGILLANCAATLNPERIVIGGGFGRTTFDLLIPGAKAEMKRRTHSVSHSQLDIVPSALLSSAVGAACIVWQHLAS